MKNGEEKVKVNDDGTIDWEVTIPPEIERLAAEHEARLNAELEAAGDDGDE